MAGALEVVAEFRRAAVLPDNRVAVRFTVAAIPENGRLALVRHADGRDVFGLQLCFRQDGAGDFELAGPDFTWIVFDPARLGKNLLKLLLRDATNRAAVIEKN